MLLSSSSSVSQSVSRGPNDGGGLAWVGWGRVTLYHTTLYISDGRRCLSLVCACVCVLLLLPPLATAVVVRTAPLSLGTGGGGVRA